MSARDPRSVMTTKSAVQQLHAIANSYWRDADAMKRDPEHFTPYDCVAYSTIAKELRKIAALLDEDDLGIGPGTIEVDRMKRQARP